MLAPTLSRVPAHSTPAHTPALSPRRSGRVPLIAAAGALIAALLASCSPAPSPTADEALDPDAFIEPAWQIEADIVGGVAATDDGIVAYEQVEDGLAISAWSLSGERLWSEPADPGWMHRNDELRVRAFERDGEWRVAHLSSADGGSATRGVIIRSISTGDLVASAPGILAVTPPAPCDDETDALCVVGWKSERRYAPETELRFEPRSRLWEENEQTSLPEGTDRLTSTHFTRDDGADISIGRFTAGSAVWEADLTDLTDGLTSYGAWGITDGEGDNPTLMWFAAALGDDRAGSLTDQAVLAIDPGTGERKWLEASAGLCGALVRPLQTDPVVVCRYRSGVEHVKDNDRLVTGVEMSMAGIDLATGDEVWSVEVDGRSSHVMWTEGRHSAPAGFATVHIDDTLHRLDLRTGGTELLDEDAVFACDLELGTVELEGSSELLDFDAGTVTVPCNAEGDRVEQWSVSAVQSGAWQADDSTAIVRTAEGFAAFPLPAEVDEEQEEDLDDTEA